MGNTSNDKIPIMLTTDEIHFLKHLTDFAYNRQDELLKSSSASFEGISHRVARRLAGSIYNKLLPYVK